MIGATLFIIVILFFVYVWWKCTWARVNQINITDVFIEIERLSGKEDIKKYIEYFGGEIIDKSFAREVISSIHSRNSRVMYPTKYMCDTRALTWSEYYAQAAIEEIR